MVKPGTLRLMHTINLKDHWLNAPNPPQNYRTGGCASPSLDMPNQPNSATPRMQLPFSTCSSFEAPTSPPPERVRRV